MTQDCNASHKLLLDPKEAARLLSVAPRTVYALVAAGRIPCVRIGRSVRLQRKTVEQIAENGLPA